MKRSLIILSIFISAAIVSGCGDEQDPRLSDADVACLKSIRYGGSCNGNSTATETVTSVSTVTVTSTE